MKRRLLAILLTLSMALTLAPGAAMMEIYGDEPETNEALNLPDEGAQEPEVETYSDVFTTAADVPTFFDVTGATAEPIANFTTFGNQLGTNAATIYAALVNGIATIKAGNAVTVTGLFTESDVADAVAAFDRDHSEVFWTSGFGYTNYHSSISLTLPRSYSWEAGRRNITADEQTVRDKVNEIAVAAQNASSNKSEQLAYVHDWLVKNNAYPSSYNQATDSTHWEAISALDSTLSPVCEGYSRAFKLICGKLGIPCVLVSGDGIDSNGRGGAHMWNYVQLENKWYAVDVTWDDPIPDRGPSAEVLRTWFLKGSGSFTRHVPQSNNYLQDGHMTFAYPILNATDYVTLPALAGMVTISGTPAFGQTLTAAYTAGNSDTTLQYQWYRGTTAIPGATGSTYTLVAADVGQRIKVEVRDANHSGSVASELTAAVAKATQAAPAAPTAEATGSTITVTAPTGGTYEYAVSTTTAAPASGWQNSATFTNKAPGTYYAFARLKETATHSVSPASPASAAVTVKRVLTAADFTYTTNTAVYTGSPNPATVTGPEGVVFTRKYNGSDTVPTNAGTYALTIVVPDGANYTGGTFDLGTWTITQATPTLTVTTPITVVKGATASLTATVKGVDGAAIANPGLTYRSGDESRVTVASDGTVTGVDVTTAGVAVTVSFPGNTNYRAVSRTVTVNVTEKQPATVNFANAPNKTYDPAGCMLGDQFTAATVTLTGGTADASKLKYQYNGADYTLDTLKTVKVTEAGTYEVTAVYEDATYYGAKKASFTITKADQAALTVSAASVPYQGTLTLTASGGSGDGAVTYTVGSGTGSAAISGNTLTATGVGAVTVTATKAGGNNYNDVTSAPATITITKAASPTNQTQAVNVYFGAASGTVTLVKPTVAGELGAQTYAVAVTSDTDSIIKGMPTVNPTTGVLTYELNSGLTKDKTATITVTVTSANYEDYTVTVTVTLVDKLPQTPPAAPVLAYTLNPDRQTYTVTIPAVTGAEYSFDGTAWTAVNTLATAVPGSTVTGYIRMAETATHLASPAASAAVTLPKVKALTPVATPAGGSYAGDVEITLACGDAGAAIYYTTNGEVPDPTLESDNGTVLYTESFTVKPTATVMAVAVPPAEKAAIMVASDVMTEVYTLYNPAPAIPAPPPGLPSGGGTGSTGSGGTQTPETPSQQPSVTPSPSGQEVVAVPETDVSGSTATAAVSESMGRDMVDQAVRNGSDTVTIAPETPAGVSRTEVSIPSAVVGDIAGKTDAALKVETKNVDVTIPNSALSGLAKQGGEVAVSVEKNGSTVSLEITAAGKPVSNVGGVTVEVSEPGCTAGTVAMLVNEDGSLQVIRQSLASDGTVTVPLNGSAKVVLVDNSKSFADVPASSWASDAVAFASSHELMTGTSSDSFAPGAAMTRGMLAVVLHNLASNPDGAASAGFSDVGDSWYTEAVNWAVSQSIISGYGDGSFGPNDEITREQLAIMLYRYAGSPTVSSSGLPFVDADEVSGYAQQAIAWASANGIMSGKSGGVLDPKGGATRAEVAQMLLNFVASQSR